jgi:hypothetical protein
MLMEENEYFITEEAPYYRAVLFHFKEAEVLY